MINVLKRLIILKSYDEESMSEINSEDIYFSFPSELFVEYRKLTRNDYYSLGILTKENIDIPTIEGVILFGNDRLSYFKDVWIQLGRFGGNGEFSIKCVKVKTRSISQVVYSLQLAAHFRSLCVSFLVYLL